MTALFQTNPETVFGGVVQHPPGTFGPEGRAVDPEVHPHRGRALLLPRRRHVGGVRVVAGDQREVAEAQAALGRGGRGGRGGLEVHLSGRSVEPSSTRRWTRQ